MSSPWGKVPQVQPVNLSEIMSEEVAREIQAKEFAAVTVHAAAIQVQEAQQQQQQKDGGAACPLVVDDDELAKSDAEIAMMLQQQFDKEYDDNLKKYEDKCNKGYTKVTISFSNYRRAPLNPDFESDSEEEEEPEDLLKDWDRFDGVQRDYAAIPACGYKMKNGNIVTKHDTEINGRRNAYKMMSFPPEFKSGDGAGFDLQLPNKVFNSLRLHSKEEQLRRHRFRDRREDNATAEFGLDEKTRLVLYKMIMNQLLQRINGVISIGKEAVVLHADSDPKYAACKLPKECVLKVFKTTLSEYKQRDKYIRDDFRFKDRIGKQTSKKVVHLWAEKEMRNLNRLRKAGIPAPQVVALKQHVLVMSFIGKNHKPAPKLKEAKMCDADLIVAYDQVLDAMKKLYNEANLIHADLSEYNILWHKDTCYIIDVSQSVEPSHNNAFHFLIRDCTNISNFFARKGVPNVDTPEAMFKSIVGFDFGDRVSLIELQESFKMKPHLVDRPGIDLNYKFDNAWEKTQLAKQVEKHVTPVETSAT